MVSWFTAIPLVTVLCANGNPDAAEDPTRSSDVLRGWLENMVVYHRFDADEVASALGVPVREASELLERHEIRARSFPLREKGRLRVLPYPGGRHPRIGFLDGAIQPHRDTKASIFVPWEGGGYVVVDCPEAIWRNGELAYLAHTHIQTVWDRRGVRLERIDWSRRSNGELRARRELPDGFAFRAKVYPRPDVVDLELRLSNGTSERATGLKVQVCVLLKGAPDFAAQTDENKVVDGRAVAVSSPDGSRWLVTVWERGKPWDNPPCPCLHSDPIFPDLEPGESATLRGRVFFFEGKDVRAEIQRRRASGTLDFQPRVS